MESVDTSILSFIYSSFPRGRIFFAEDLEGTGYPPDVIRFSLSRIVAGENSVIRLARGMYCYPHQEEYSLKIVYPSVEDMAAALAGRWKVRIAPCGARAAFLSGLTGIVLDGNTWISDGSDQTFRLQDGREIRFVRRVSLKVFQYRSEVMRNLVEGLRYIGRDGVGEGERGVVAENLRKVSGEDFVHDIRLAPSWVRELLKEYV